MNTHTLLPALSATAFLVSLATLHGAGTQVGDLRLPSTTYSGGVTYFDPASPTHQTRAVVGAPVQTVSDFVAVSQNPDGGAPDSGTDIGLQTFSSATVVRQINRFTSDQDGPGTAGGPQRIGAVQWTIDLSPLGGYLSGNNLDLTALDLRLVTDPSDDGKLYDVYLSYTNAAESIALAGLGTGLTAGGDNYGNFWFPAQSTAEGGVANGTHRVVELDFAGNMDLNLDLLGLYEAGVTDFNLILASGDFFSGRTIGIQDGSGISIDTIPEPAALSLLGLCSLMMLRRKR